MEPTLATLSTLVEVGKAITSTLELDDLLDVILENLQRVVPYDAADFFLIDETGTQVRCVACRSLKSASWKGMEMEIGEGITGRVAQSGQAIWLRDARRDERVIPTPLVAGSGMMVPLVHRGQVLGVLGVANEAVDSFQVGDLDLLLSFAGQAAIAVENSRLYQQQKSAVARLQELNHVIARQHETLARATATHARLIQMVLEGRGIQPITETLAVLLDSPVVVENQLFHLIAQSIPQDGADPARRQTLSVGLTPASVLDEPAFRATVEMMARDGRARLLSALPEHGLERRRIAAPILAGRDVLGYVFVLEGTRPFVEMDLQAVEQAAVVLALELMKQRAAAEAELRLRADFLGDLVAGQVGNPDLLVHRAALLGVDLLRPLRVLAADLDDPTPSADSTSGGAERRRLFDAFADVLRRRGRGETAVLQSQGIVVLMPVPADAVDDGPVRTLVEQVRHHRKRLRESVTFSVAIGRHATGIDEVRRSYGEARRALDAVRSLRRQAQTVTLEQLGIYGLLFRPDSDSELLEFAHTTLRPLLEYDTRHGTALVPTLEAFIEEGCNLHRTARALFVHLNTLRYRLERIAALGGFDLHDSTTRLNLQLALRVHRLRSGPLPHRKRGDGASAGTDGITPLP
ncbi:MAG: helix-turn-helix domain-containing protein [Chloroflexi bacterium]|nr:helix-turn-helix domain-containing protein [Chloroflexota bacterium]